MVVKTRFLIAAYLLVTICVNSLASSQLDRIHGHIQQYFQQVLNSSADMTDVTMGRVSDSFTSLCTNKQLKISSQRKRHRLGKQTIWVEAYDGMLLVKKIPVQVDVALLKRTCIVKNKINRHQSISADDVVVELKRFERMNGTPCQNPDDVIGLQPTRVLRAGSVVFSEYLRKPPVIASGDHVKVQIKTNNLVITTSGIAKEEGSEGQRISVLCEATGKKIDGLVVAPNLVILSREIYK